MLVLTRRRGESIHIGEGIIVTILDVRPSRTRIGIDAPATVRVHRDETLFAADGENLVETIDGNSGMAPLREVSVKTPADSVTLGGFQNTKAAVAGI